LLIQRSDLGLLKRDKKLQTRYKAWADGIKARHGSVVDYLLHERLQWGRPDTISLIRSTLEIPPALDDRAIVAPHRHLRRDGVIVPNDLPPIPPEEGEYFKADMSPQLISVIMNDWPYSVPVEVEHALVWTRLPIIHPFIVDHTISARVNQDGLWGFTGQESDPPSPSLLPTCLPALADWGVTEDKLIKSHQPTVEEQRALDIASHEVQTYVKRTWIEKEWETAWFVNPPRLQSIPGLAHIHVFAKRK